MIYCLIGSTKFLDSFIKVEQTLALLGHNVLSLSIPNSPLLSEQLTSDQKETLDLVHLQKISIADAVIWITDNNNYIGESTRRELKWAHMLNKPVHHCDAVLYCTHDYSSAFNLFDRCYPTVQDVGNDNTRRKKKNKKI